MDRTKKTRLVLTAMILVIVFVTLSVASVYAVLFSSYVPIDSTVSVHVIGSDATTISISLGESQDLSFASAGDKIDFTLELQNQSSEVFHYYYKLGIVADSTGLQDAVMVYLDGEFLGSLSSLCSGGEKAVIDNNLFILGGSAETPKVKSHVLSFELHMAATDTYYSDKSVKISLDSYAVTPDFQSDIFVYNETDFYNAVNDVNYGDIAYTIRLCSDITLTKNYELKNPCSIDLMGNELVFGDNNITLTQDGTVTFFTSEKVDYAALTEGTGGFILNDTNCVLDINEFYCTVDSVTTDVALLYSNRTTINSVSGETTTYLCDTTAAAKLICDRFLDRVGNGINRGESVSLFGALDFYAASGAVTVGDIQTEDYTYITQTRYIVAPEQPAVLDTSDNARTYPTYITVSGEEINFEIIGTGDYQILQSILENELAHIPDNMQEDVSYDLFLPILLQNRNASIEWWSSNESLIKPSGQVGETAQGQVSLVATIRINESVFSKVFSFVVYRQDNEMKFQYLLALMNPITLSEVYDATGSVVALPVVDEESDNDYRTIITNGSDLGLTKLEYSVEPVYYYMTLADDDTDGYFNDLYLTQATFQSYALLNVRGYFDEDFTEYYEGTVGVQISLGNNSDLINTVFSYVQGKLNEVDVLQNIIDTRVQDGMANEKGDFTLPTRYLGFTIEYSIPTAQNRLETIVEQYAGTDSDYLALIEWAMSSTSDIRADAIVADINQTVAAYVSNGIHTISSDEETAILTYAADHGYVAYATEWAKYITPTQRTLTYDVANGVITNITCNAETRTCVVSVTPTKFYSVETQIPIDVSIYLEDIVVGKETRALTFSTPATLHTDANGFSDEEVFRSIKLQIWQQLPVDERKDLPVTQETIVFDDSPIWDYILARDIQFCKALVFENGSDEDKFYALLGWAESVTNEGQTASEVVPTIDTAVADNASDGHSFICTDEEAAILNLGGQFSEETDIFKFADAWNVAIEDVYYLSPEAITAIINGVNAQADTLVLTYTEGSASDTINEFMIWATSTVKYNWFWIFGHYAYFSDVGITLAGDITGTGIGSQTQCDGTRYITSSEATLAKNAWVIDYNFRAFGAAWDAVIGSVYPYTNTTATNANTTIGNNIRDRMRLIIKQDFAALLTWATSTGNAGVTASSISTSVDYFDTYGGNISDGRETVTYSEKAAIDEFISNAFRGAYNTNFATLWTANAQNKLAYNMSVTYIDKDGNTVQQGGVNVTGSGKEYLMYFVNSLIPDDGSEILLVSDVSISFGMDAILNQGYSEKAGSCYWYTGTSTASYTNGNVYRLLLNEGVYTYENLNVTLAALDSDMASALALATEENIGDYYLFQGQPTEDYDYGYVYTLCYSVINESYYFEKMCVAFIVTTVEGETPLNYIYVSSLNSSLNGITRFKNLTNVQVIGSSDSNMRIFETVNAQTFLGLLSINSSDITKLHLNYCSLNNISCLSRLSKITNLSLLGNDYLTNICQLQNLDIENLSYLDICGIGIDTEEFVFYVSDLSIIYEKYYDAHAVYPTIYTEYVYDFGTDTSTKIGKNEFSITLSTNQKLALYYLYYLNNMQTIKSSSLQVPAYVFINSSNNTCPLVWAIESGSEAISLTSRTDGVTVYQIFEKLSSGASVISVTATVNGETFTRYFILTLTN
ncbi:MAG TPA: leucine-rich repeat domain-containing protein [Clostridia bacterium]|nr:leucine-rich repeat domain-containing protein [Clostridia bacterium]